MQKNIELEDHKLGKMYINGAELFKQNFIMIQGHLYNEFTKNKTDFPTRLSYEWDSKRGSITLLSDNEGSMGFSSEHDLPSKPKPRARIRCKTMLKKLKLDWPKELLKEGNIRIPYLFKDGKIELFWNKMIELEKLKRCVAMKEI